MRCVVDKNIYNTIWPFSDAQALGYLYSLGGGLVSEALWFEVRSQSSKYQTISYETDVHLKSLQSSFSSCVQYIMPCASLHDSMNVTLSWKNKNGIQFNMLIDTKGCMGYCLGFG